MPSRLDGLQQRILEVLATTAPDWTLTGGAALAGYHLHHRGTEDLVLFFSKAALGREADAIRGHLSSAGLAVAPIQRSPGFVRLRVSAGGETVVVDLVADPVHRIEEPIEVAPGIRVDTPP